MKQAVRIILFSTVLALTVGSQGFAQSYPLDEYTDVILLKNGASIKGKMIEMIPDKHLRIERVGDWQVFEVPVKKIYKITDVNNYDKVRAEFEALPKQESAFTRLKILTRIGFLSGNNSTILSAAVEGGGYLQDVLFASLGLGFDNEAKGVVPVFVRSRAYVNLTEKTKGYVYADAGYSFRWLSEGPYGGGFGGLTVGLGAGVQLPFETLARFDVQIGYRRQAAKNVSFYRSEDDYHTYSADMDYFAVMIGYEY